MQQSMTLKSPSGSTTAKLTQRQQQVLSSVLDLIKETGDSFSMAAVARRARCSKETLYRWFGGREGLLTATVRWQAAKVQMPDLPEAGLTRQSYAAVLEGFAASWLTVITGDVSVALNRLAITHAGSAQSDLGQIVLQNGPNAMAQRLQPVFRLGRDAGLIRYADGASPFRTFFGLVVADVQIRALLGDDPRPDRYEITACARRAVEQFLLIYAAPDRDAPATGPSIRIL